MISISIPQKCGVAFLVLTILLAKAVTHKLGKIISSGIRGPVEIHPLHEKPGQTIPTEPSWYNAEHKDPVPRIALIMFGVLDHLSGFRPDRKVPPYEESLPKSFSSIKQHVIRPAQENGYAVDIFAHSWNFEEEELFLKVYQPNASLFEPGNGRLMFHSIEAGLKLRRDFEKRASVTYDWVLVMRHDIFFYNKYDLTELNDQLFYIANWCLFAQGMTLEQQIKWGAQHGTERCVALRPLDGDWGVPDFLFVSSPRNIDLVFIGLLKDLQNGVFEKKHSSCCAHGMAGGRIDSLHAAGLLRLGRYKTHTYDFTVFRDVTAAQEALSNTDTGFWLYPNDNNWTEDQAHTQCRDSARYCFNVSNNSCPFPQCKCPTETC